MAHLPALPDEWLDLVPPDPRGVHDRPIRAEDLQAAWWSLCRRAGDRYRAVAAEVLAVLMETRRRHEDDLLLARAEALVSRKALPQLRRMVLDAEVSVLGLSQFLLPQVRQADGGSAYRPVLAAAVRFLRELDRSPLRALRDGDSIPTRGRGRPAVKARPSGRAALRALGVPAADVTRLLVGIGVLPIPRGRRWTPPL